MTEIKSPGGSFALSIKLSELTFGQPCPDCGSEIADGGSVGLYCTNARCPGDERIKRQMHAHWTSNRPEALRTELDSLRSRLQAAEKERDEAKSALESQARQIEELRSALEPFARDAFSWDARVPDYAPVVIDGCEEAAFTVGDVRRASSVLQQGEGG